MLFYECKISYTRRCADDTVGKVTETYLIEGINPTDCEKRLIDEIQPQLYGDYEVQQMKKAQYYDLFVGDGENYYKGKVELITVEESGVETRKRVNVLLTDNTLSGALTKMAGQMAYLDCELVSIAKSRIVDVLRATNEPENENN